MSVQLDVMRGVVLKAMHCAHARDYPGLLVCMSRLLPSVAVLATSRAPDPGAARRLWDRHAIPLHAELRTLHGCLATWIQTPTRRGPTVNVAWAAWIVHDAMVLLRHRPEGDDGGGVLALLPPPDGDGDDEFCAGLRDGCGAPKSPLPQPGRN